MEIGGCQLWELLRTETNLLLAVGRQGNGFLKLHIANPTTQRSFHWLVVCITDEDRRTDTDGLHVGREFCLHIRITHAGHTSTGQIDLVPDTDLTSTNRCNPVPADRRMKSRIVGSKDATIKLRRILVLLLDCPEMLITNHFHCQIVFTFLEQARHIKLATHEGTTDTTQLLAVQEYVGLPVNAVEVQPLLTFRFYRHIKFIAIPEIRAEE